MTARTTRRTRLIAAVSATAGALALSLLPTTAAHAALPPGLTEPVFSFVDNGTLVPSAGSADSVTTSPIVPAGYRAYDVDVTPDGNTAVMSLCNGTIAACTDTPNGSRFDATYGVLLVHNEGVGIPVSSRLLTNLTSTNAVVSADGLKVMWMYGSTLYTFDTTTELYTTSALAAPKVATEFPTRLAVSGDGSNVAVLYRDATGATAGRVLAFPTAATTLTTSTTYFQKTYPKTVPAPGKPLRPSSATFTFVGNTDIVYNEFDSSIPATSPTPRLAVRGTLTLNNGGGTPVEAALDPSLTDFYRLRQDNLGNWWAWKDVDGGGATSTTDATVSNISDPLAVAPVINQGSTRTDSATTYGYTPSIVAPPVFDATTVSNPAPSHPTFGFSASTVLYNGRSAYQTFNLYGGRPDGLFAANPADAAETDRALLQQSFDGKTWTRGIQTSGARAFVLGTKFYNGYVTSVRRTTYYRWTWAGDAFTTKFTTSARKVTVVPIVTAKVKVSGASRIVTGTATRPTGTVFLQRLVGRKWLNVVRVALVKSGTYTSVYSFGKRVLKKGSYRSVTVGDSYAATGLKVFKV
jgi:hypothetical protein